MLLAPANEESHSANEVFYLKNATSSTTISTKNGSGDAVNSESDHGNVVLTAYALVVSIGFLLNILVIYLVLVKLVNEKRQGNYAHLLVAHLSLVSICLAVVTPFNTSNQDYFIQVSGANCCWMVYLKSVFLCSFSINVVLITFERLQSFNGSQQRQGRLWAVYMLVFMWLFSLFFNIPTTQMTKPRQGIFLQNEASKQTSFTGNCVTMNLYGSPVVTVAYESIRFALFHAAVVVYMVYALVKVRSCFRYLYQKSVKLTSLTYSSPSESTVRKLRSVRLICFHFLTFILIWLPAGLLVFIRRVLNRVDGDSFVKGVSGYIASAVPVYVLINPLISLLLLESNIWRFCCSRKNGCESGQGLGSEQLSERCLNGNTSRISTAAFTSEEKVDRENIPLDVQAVQVTAENCSRDV